MRRFLGKVFSPEVLISFTFICIIGIAYAAIRNHSEHIKVDFTDIEKRAQTLAQKPYKPSPIEVPPFLQKLTYDQHRDIRFNVEKALWHNTNLPFQIQFFHPGYIFNKTVSINETNSHFTRKIPFNSSFFNYGNNTFLPSEIPLTMGYSGFRVHHPLNRQEYFDEILVFQGASYFRSLGKGQGYGISARGLAINSGELVKEEFPVFEEFWLETPKNNSTDLKFYALMNSPSVTGAYEFTLIPNDNTKVQVRCTLYFRDSISVLGVAPLTSMFWYGENSSTTYGDFRPEVHDSDGLLVHTNTHEWIWRPLVNDPNKMRIATFEDSNIRGFGLLQRDRQFDHYQDLEALYHKRPSLWIEPLNEWGKGHVRLIEMSTPNETNDNIVAFWVPQETPKKGTPLHLEYMMHWGNYNSPAGYAASTRWSNLLDKSKEKKVVIEFAGQNLQNLSKDLPLEPVVTVQGAAVLTEQILEKNPFMQTWRLVIRVRIQDRNAPVEMRAFLKQGNDILTETWTYSLNP